MNPSAVIRVASLLVLLAAVAFTAWRVTSTDGAVDALLAQAEPIASRVRDRVRDAISTGDPAEPPGVEPTAVRPPAVDPSGNGIGADTSLPDPGTPDASPPTATPRTDTLGASSSVTPAVRAPAAGSEAPTPSQTGDGMLRTAMVRASPPGTSIRVDGQPGVWQNDVALSVGDGDSLLVRFERQGYVATTRVFKGSRISVALRPDSVSVRFAANVPADVYIEYADGARRRIGTTNFSARLPAGTHRFVFVAPGQAEYVTDERMTRAGDLYRVTKLDYVTEGSLTATATPWAWVSVDGGPPRETPARFEGLAAGTHAITVTRDGYESIADSVVVRPGYVVKKRYTLAPRR